MSFATLQEAWGVPSFGTPEPDKPEEKQPQVQSEVLERTEASQRSHLFAVNYLREVFQRHGAPGVLSLMDEDMQREVRMAALLSFDWVDTNSLLFIFMCLCAIWLVMDLLRR